MKALKHRTLKEEYGDIIPSRSQCFKRERDGTFPKRVRFGKNSVGWFISDIEEWIASQPRGLNSSEDVAA